MQKDILLTLTLILAVSTNAFAQAGAKPAPEVTVDDLSAPSSPAFVLLGVSPAAVERPETPKAFTLNLLHTLAKSEGIPRNFALEVAPYWLKSHSNLTFGTYQNPSVGQSILQTLAISVGTAPIPGATSEDEPLGTKVGLGVRTAIVNGNPNPKLNDLVDQMDKAADVILDGSDKEEPLLANVKNARSTLELLEKRAKGNPTDEELKAQIAKAQAALTAVQEELAPVQQMIAEARAKATTLALEVQALDAERVGFFLNVAAGQVWTVFADDVRNSKSEKRGFWLTPSYRWRGCAATDACESSVDAIGVARVLKEPELDALCDVGGRIVWRANKELNLSLETVRRFQSGSDADEEADSNRTVGIVEYRIRQDLILFGSFGQDFKELTGKKPLVSFLGLNIGFGDKPKVVLTNEKPQ